MQGMSGLGVGANHTLERRHSAEKKFRALWRIFVISSFMFLRRRRGGRSDMMDPNKVSDLVKGTGIEDEDRMSASSAW